MRTHQIETDLIELAKEYLGKWVALDPEDQSIVIASGETAKEVLESAEAVGVGSPVILWVADDYGSIVS